MAKVAEIQAYLESWVPTSTAFDWDNCGLLCGDSSGEVTRVLVALDVTKEVVEEAIQKGAELIFSHHPVIFSPIKRVTADDLTGQLIRTLIQNNIHVISMHTNLDIAPDGVNDILARKLHLNNCEILTVEHRVAYKKIGVTVPKEFVARVREAMFEAGGGQYGKYSGCCFQTVGEGTFLPMPGAEPFIGEAGKMETVQEIRLEMVVKDTLLSGVIAALLAAHPYETPAYDVVPTEALSEERGMGRIGDLGREMTKGEFLSFVCDTLHCQGLRYSGEKETVKRVAVAGGAGVSCMGDAIRRGADVFVTADVKYHEMLDCAQQGFFVVDAGHFPTEDGVCDYMVARVAQHFHGLEVWKSEAHEDTTQFFVREEK